jgi:hydrogenase maturation protease
MATNKVIILGVGNILFSDEGFGIRVIEKIQEKYSFPEDVAVVDGGVLGLNLLGTISGCEYLIVVDAIRNNCTAGSVYRLEGDEIPERMRAKNSLHQVDLLEALTLCKALDNVPETVILGIEPEDIETTGLELTPAVRDKIDDIIALVLKELDNLGVAYRSNNLCV